MFEIADISPKNPEPILILDEDEKKFAEHFIEKNKLIHDKPLIGINTGSGGRWQYKKWGIENTSLLINRIIEELNSDILLLGGPEEAERNQRIKSLVKYPVFDSGTNNTIRQFASLINLCDLIITSDSLAMHIAIALKKAVIVFFGPTSSAEIELYGRGIKIESPIECVCCYLTKCAKSPTCMDKITVNMMIDKIKKYTHPQKFFSRKTFVAS